MSVVFVGSVSSSRQPTFYDIFETLWAHTGSNTGSRLHAGTWINFN